MEEHLYHLCLGLIGSVSLMFGAKALGKFLLYRKEDYYD